MKKIYFIFVLLTAGSVQAAGLQQLVDSFKKPVAPAPAPQAPKPPQPPKSPTGK